MDRCNASSEIPSFHAAPSFGTASPMDVLLCRMDEKSACGGEAQAPRRIRLAFLQRGHMEVFCAGRCVPLEKGDILLLPPDAPLQLPATFACRTEWLRLEFSPELLPQDGCADGALNCITPYLTPSAGFWVERVNTAQQFELEDLLHAMAAECRQEREGRLLKLQALAISVLVLFCRLQQAAWHHGSDLSWEDAQRQDILRSLRYIRSHFSDPISLTQIAAEVQLSPSYYSCLFKKATQYTFVEYVNLLRVQKAMDLLCSGDDRIVDICFACGFQNVNHFNRMFKSIAGVSPREYRRSQHCLASVPRAV